MITKKLYADIKIVTDIEIEDNEDLGNYDYYDTETDYQYIEIDHYENRSEIFELRKQLKRNEADFGHLFSCPCDIYVCEDTKTIELTAYHNDQDGDNNYSKTSRAIICAEEHGLLIYNTVLRLNNEYIAA